MAGIDDRSMYEADRLDEFLSEIVRSESTTRWSVGLDPALAETVRAVASLAVAPAPAAGFARHLRAELMLQADAIIAALPAPSLARPANRRLPLPRPGWLLALPSRGERRRWALAQ
ncbi:MAG TPA: hypothetical protein VKB09_16320, partial [Thermomicrobiales bacterium]|nr:hypothetical protein [Thermomicrobiales bacterium]